MNDAKWPYTGLPAQSEKLTAADFKTPLPASHPARITPPEDDDPWRDVRLPWTETLIVVGTWAAGLALFVASIALVRAVFS